MRWAAVVGLSLACAPVPRAGSNGADVWSDEGLLAEQTSGAVPVFCRPLVKGYLLRVGSSNFPHPPGGPFSRKPGSGAVIQPMNATLLSGISGSQWKMGATSGL